MMLFSSSLLALLASPTAALKGPARRPHLAHLAPAHSLTSRRAALAGLAALPAVLLPRKGKYGLIDYEKAFCPDLKDGPDLFDLRGIDRTRGALLIVRPDQFVAQVLPLDAHDAVGAFFAGVLIPVPDPVDGRQPGAARSQTDANACGFSAVASPGCGQNGRATGGT